MSFLAAAVLAVSPLLAAAGAELTQLPPPGGEGAARGVALVRCSVGEGNFWVSRGGVLDVGAGRGGDVLLTTAHGLPPGEDAVLRECRVIVRGKAYRVRAVWRPAEAGPHDDWAVLLSRHLPEDLERLRPGRVEPEWLAGMVLRGASVRVVLRYADTSQSDCTLEQRPSTAWPLVPHSCLGYPGMSGSPLVVGIGGEPLVIGLHVGTQLEFDGSKLDFIRVGRALDAEIGAAISTAAAWAGERRR